METRMKKTFWILPRFLAGKLSGLRTKFLITFVLLMVIPVLILGSILYFTNPAIAQHRSMSTGSFMMDEVSLNMNLLMDSIETASAQIMLDAELVKYLTLIENPEDSKNGRIQVTAAINKLFEPWLTLNKPIQKIMILGSQKSSINYSFQSPEDFTKATGSAWYKEAVALNGKPLWVISRPEMNTPENYGLICIRLIPASQNTAIKYLLIVAIGRDALNRIFSQPLSAGGAVYLISPNTDFFRAEHSSGLYSPLEKGNKDQIISEIIQSAEFQKQTADQTLTRMEIPAGKNAKAFLQRLDNPGWFLCGLLLEEEFTGPFSITGYIYLGIGLILIVFGIWGSLAFSRKLTTAINSVISALRTVESGDFTQKIRIARKDEIGALAFTYNIMIDNYQRLISAVDEIILKLNEIASQIIGVSGEVIGSFAAISGILEEVAQSASEQANDAFRCASNMNTLTGCIRIVNDCTPLIQQIKADILQLTSKGKVVLENLEIKSEETKQITVEINRLIYALSEKTEEIQDIVVQIKGIVNETSMISLNATIEATRIKHINKEVIALASDVKKHVDYSVVATKKITDVIQSIEVKTKQATEMASVADHTVESQNIIIKKCAEIFNDISNSSDTLVARFETVIGLMAEIETNKNEIMELTAAVSSETEEIAAMTQELSASSQEQRNSMDNLTMNADELKEQAANLNDEIRRFKI